MREILQAMVVGTVFGVVAGYFLRLWTLREVAIWWVARTGVSKNTGTRRHIQVPAWRLVDSDSYHYPLVDMPLTDEQIGRLWDAIWSEGEVEIVLERRKPGGLVS